MAGNVSPSSLLLMLPQLEQSALYNAANFNSKNINGFWNTQNVVNSTVQFTVINTFLCPSDLNRIDLSTNGFTLGKPGATNYAANAGSTANSFGVASVNNASGPYPGSTGLLVKLSNITDGTSNTIGFAEIVKGVGGFANNLDNLKPSATPVKLSTANTGDPQTDYNACKAGVPSTVGANSGGFPLGAMWSWGRSGQNRYNGVMPPNSFSCDFGGFNSDSDNDAITAGSRHPGVVNCLMMDASVRGIKSTVNPATWWGLSTMAGGEVISADSY